MNGIVISSFIDYVENQYGINTLNELEKINPNGVSYTSIKSYEDEEFFILLSNLSKLTNKNSSDLSFEFGVFFFSILKDNYTILFEQKNFIEFLKYLDQYIHPMVLNTIPNTYTPKFTLTEDKNGYELLYISKRGMHQFAFGLLESCNIFFSSQFKIEMNIISKEKSKFSITNG